MRTGCVCGARAIAAPQTDAIVALPRVSGAVFGLICTILGLGSFLIPWLIAPALLGAYASVVAYHQARREPDRFGGLRLAQVGVALSGLLLPGLLVYGGYRAERWYADSQERARAASRARMLELALAIQAYQKQQGMLPSPELQELQMTGAISSPLTDAWGKKLRYQPTSELAATTPLAAPPLTQYRIVAAGADGEFGTADDLVLQDGVFVPVASETDK
ncbi:MAG: hypothetical protein ACUVR8_06385 [Acidobacteriota bacterium]